MAGSSLGSVWVTVKRVIDPYVKIRVKPCHGGVETQNVKMSINPFDDVALEQAVQFREHHQCDEVVVISIGDDSCTETLRQTLAKGADRAILIRTDIKQCSLNVAKIIHSLVLKNPPKLILIGKQSIDDDNNQTPQMLAALLNWPQATFASKLEYVDETLKVTREVDHGLEFLSLELPAVVSVDLRLNKPRYASLPNIMQAKNKPLEVIELASLGLSLKNHLEILSVQPPLPRSVGVRLDSVSALVQQLKQDQLI